MPYHQYEQIRYFTFDSLDSHAVRHAMFSRQGGISVPPWDSLNVGSTVGDDPASVKENRQRMFSSLNCEISKSYTVWQVHGKEIVCADSPLASIDAIQKADAVLTNQKALTLFMRFADCVPILLYDPHQHVIGLIHAGWLGTVSGIAAATVEKMSNKYGSKREHILAGIGPSIGAHHYEVGPEVVDEVMRTFKRDANEVLIEPQANRDGHMQFDLWKANEIVLQQAGIRQIEISSICTACHLEDWYSHRGEHGRTGRFGALICLD